LTEHRALFWQFNETTGKADCFLCPHFCHISEGQLGLCKTRKNINNVLIANNYGKVASAAVDPIEKKPLYHYKPGSKILSFGTYGCNMRCAFCQNYSISQQEVETDYFEPDDVLALMGRVSDSIGVAFTYNEPFMWYEFMYDTAKKIKEKDKSKVVVIVSNGYVNPEPLEAILPYVDALNIDLKTYLDKTYRKLCGATLDPVLRTIEAASRKSHVEVTTLMVTGENDSIEETIDIAKFLSAIDKNIPLHLSRYFPRYKMTSEATDINLIKRARDAAKEYLKFVYIGNIEGVDDNTYCPNCHELLVEREYYDVKNHMTTDQCPKCGEKIPIVL
jgi:pyruvate formate lyase activating enzyme